MDRWTDKPVKILLIISMTFKMRAKKKKKREKKCCLHVDHGVSSQISLKQNQRLFINFLCWNQFLLLLHDNKQGCDITHSHRSSLSRGKKAATVNWTSESGTPNSGGRIFLACLQLTEAVKLLRFTQQQLGVKRGSAWTAICQTSIEESVRHTRRRKTPSPVIPPRCVDMQTMFELDVR